MFMAHVRRARRTEAAGALKGAGAILAVFAAGFIIGRVKISDDLWPFGTAFVIAAFLNGNRVNPYAALAGVLAALATQITEMGNVAYHFSVVTICAVILIGYSCVKGRPGKKVAIVAGVAAYVLCTLFFKLTLILNVLSSLAEMALCGLAVVMLSIGIRVASRGIRRSVMTDEEIVSAVFGLMLVVLGIGGVNVAGVYLRHIAMAYLTAVGAFCGGSAIGAAVGGISGLACMLAGDAPALLALAVIPGTVAGALKRFQKVGVLVGYLVSCAVMILYVSGTYGGFSMLFSAGIGAGLFFVTPKKALEKIGGYIDETKSRERAQVMHQRRFAAVLHSRVRAMSAALEKAAAAAEYQQDRRRETDRLVCAQMRSLCQRCGQYEDCWDGRGRDTYRDTVALFERFRTGGTLKEAMPACCEREVFCNTAQAVWRRYVELDGERRRSWQGRRAAGNEFHGAAQVLEAMGRDVQCEVRFREDVEEEVRSALEREGIAVREVWADMAERTLKVGLQRKKCNREGECLAHMTELVSRACGAPMAPDKYTCPVHGDGECAVCFVQEGEFEVEVCACGVPRQGREVSGDVHLEERLEDNRYMLVLCDGMGNGRRARQESGTAAGLVRDFYRAGFDDATVAEAVNKMMLMTGGEEMFSTVDICTIDCATGHARFLKTGAPPSYLVRGQVAEEIGEGSLPVGILENIAPNRIDKDLRNGDIVILMSDGVADRPNMNCGLVSEICGACRDTAEIAATLIEYAQNSAGGRAIDDMTVIVAKMAKRKPQ